MRRQVSPGKENGFLPVRALPARNHCSVGPGRKRSHGGVIRGKGLPGPLDGLYPHGVDILLREGGTMGDGKTQFLGS